MVRPRATRNRRATFPKDVHLILSVAMITSTCFRRAVLPATSRCCARLGVIPLSASKWKSDGLPAGKGRRGRLWLSTAAVPCATPSGPQTVSR